jgi:peptide/nickel transport system ATP-binding protein
MRHKYLQKDRKFEKPISMLDVSIRADILKLLNQLKADFQLAYLYITHDLASAKYFGDRIMVLYGGKVMETGKSNQIIGNPTHPYTRLLLSSTAGSQVAESLGETSIDPPNLLEGRLGCPFAHRCPLVMDVCRTEEPVLRLTEEGHSVACHYQA